MGQAKKRGICPSRLFQQGLPFKGQPKCILVRRLLDKICNACDLNDGLESVKSCLTRRVILPHASFVNTPCQPSCSHHQLLNLVVMRLQCLFSLDMDNGALNILTIDWNLGN